MPSRRASKSTRRASKSARRATRRATRRASKSARRATRRATRRASKSARRATRRATRRAAKRVKKSARRATRRATKSTRRAAKRVKKSKAVSDILQSSYGVTGLAKMMKENEKGYKTQQPVATKTRPWQEGWNKSVSKQTDIDTFLEGIQGDSKPKKESKEKKRPPSKYNLFVKKMSPVLKKQHPTKKQPEIMKLIAAEWNKPRAKLG
jgi:hypothetical protein